MDSNTNTLPQAVERPALGSSDLLGDLVDLRTLERNQARENLERLRRDYKALGNCYQQAVSDCNEWRHEADRLRENNERLAVALRDALSTFRHDDKTTLVTAERQEAWQTTLRMYSPKICSTVAALPAWTRAI